MENTEEVFHFLEEFSKRKTKTIPQELNDYLAYVARTGDPVYQWSLVKSLFKEKLLNVITDFYETSPGIDIPPYPNVDPFNYDVMKNSLLEKLDSFTSAPFTVQRICELLTYPRKQYNRIDKFMRAIEKNILVVSTREPGVQRHQEPENGEPMEPIVNGSDNISEYNVDVEMEDMSWKENAEQQQSTEPQPSSSDAHISVDDIEARLQAKQDAAMDTQEKTTTQYESVTPPELNVSGDEQIPEKVNDESTETAEDSDKTESASTSGSSADIKDETDNKAEAANSALVIPEIVIDDAEMTEEKLRKQSLPNIIIPEKTGETSKSDTESISTDVKSPTEIRQSSVDENSSDSNTKDEPEPKLISEVSTSSEESSSSSDNTDGNSNSPKTDIEPHIDVQEESNQSDANSEESIPKTEESKEPITTPSEVVEESPQIKIQSDNYSISDVNSELPQISSETPQKEQEKPSEEEKETLVTEEKVDEAPKADTEITDKSSEAGV